MKGNTNTRRSADRRHVSKGPRGIAYVLAAILAAATLLVDIRLEGLEIRIGTTPAATELPVAPEKPKATKRPKAKRQAGTSPRQPNTCGSSRSK